MSWFKKIFGKSEPEDPIVLSDLGERVLEYLVRHLAETHKAEVRGDETCMLRLRRVAFDAERSLATGKSHAINLPFIAVGPTRPVHLKIEITRKLLGL